MHAQCEFEHLLVQIQFEHLLVAREGEECHPKGETVQPIRHLHRDEGVDDDAVDDAGDDHDDAVDDDAVDGAGDDDHDDANDDGAQCSSIQ